MTRGQIKAQMRRGENLPEGVALDKHGAPTTDPTAAWIGQILPIGRHKGMGIIMAFEILSCVLSGNRLSGEIPSIVDHPELSADSGLFMLALDPGVVCGRKEFANRMAEFVGYVESSVATDPLQPPRFPGRRKGEIWAERRTHGIPLEGDHLDRLDGIADELAIPRLVRA